MLPSFVAELGAVAIVTDQELLRPERLWRKPVAAVVPVPMIAEDNDTVAPPALFVKQEPTAFTFRPKPWPVI